MKNKKADDLMKFGLLHTRKSDYYLTRVGAASVRKWHLSRLEGVNK